jgi:transcriptional regulator with XRE-family HTH domain
MKTAALIDLARAKANIESDYRLAKTIGVTRQMVSGWRSGSRYPGTQFIFDLAELAGRNPAEVIAEVELERESRAGHADQVEGWRGRLQRLASTAAVVALGAVVSAPSPAAAAAGNAAHVSGQPCILCQPPRRRRSWLEALFPPGALQPA